MPIDYFQGYNEGTDRLAAAFDYYGKNMREKENNVLQQALLRQKIESGELDLEQKRTRRETLADIKRIQELGEKAPREVGFGANTDKLPNSLRRLKDSLLPMEKFTADESLSPEGQYSMDKLPVLKPLETPPRESLGSNAFGPSQPDPANPPLENGSPTQYTQREKTSMMIKAALKRGDWDSLEHIGKVQDITDKIDAREAAVVSLMAQQVSNFWLKTHDREATEQFAVQLAAKMGIDPILVKGIDFINGGGILKPDGQGGQIAIMTDNQGKQHFMHIAAKDSAHNVQEVPSPDGRTAQKLQYNPETKRYDIPVGEPYKVKSQVTSVNITNPMASETYIGVGNNGAPIFKNRRGGTPFSYDGQGNKVMYTGQVNPKSTAPALGGEDAGAVIADYRSDSGAQVKTEKDMVAFKGFEQGMLKNADYALQLSKEYSRTSYPPVNRLLNALRTGTGDVKSVKFANAVYAASLEYQKIKTAGTGITSAELSIGAQQKAEELLGSSLSHKQLKGVVDVMKTDSRNIVAARQAELDAIKDRIRTRRKPTVPTPQKGKKIGRFEVEVID